MVQTPAGAERHFGKVVLYPRERHLALAGDAAQILERARIQMGRRAEVFAVGRRVFPNGRRTRSRAASSGDVELRMLEVRVFPRRRSARKVGRVAAQTGTFTLHPIFVVSG